MPRFSIIIPCYNTQRFVQQAILSCLQQSVKDLEVIVVNDGSSDASGQKIEEIAQTDARVRVIHQPNAGVGAARNAGLQEAKGEYVNFLDADDLIAPQKLELQGRVLDENPRLGLALCAMSRIDENSQPREIESCLATPVHFATGKPLAHVLISRMFAPHVPLMRTSLARQIGGFVTDRQLGATADMIFWMRASYTGAQYAVVDAPLALYRAHAAAMTADKAMMEESTQAALTHLAERYPQEFCRSVKDLQMELLWTQETTGEANRWLHAELKEKSQKVEELWECLVRERHQHETRVKNAVEYSRVLLALRQWHGTKITMWGAGNGGQRLIKQLQNAGLQVAQLVDADSKKWHTKIEGITVAPPQEVLKELSRDMHENYIFIASTFAQEIQEKLQDLGLQSPKNYFVVDFDIIYLHEELKNSQLPGHR